MFIKGFLRKAFLIRLKPKNTPDCSGVFLFDRLFFGGVRGDADNFLGLEGVIKFAFFLGAEFDYAVLERKQGIIIAAFDIGAGLIFGATLSDNDGSGFGVFSVIELDA